MTDNNIKGGKDMDSNTWQDPENLPFLKILTSTETPGARFNQKIYFPECGSLGPIYFLSFIHICTII